MRNVDFSPATAALPPSDEEERKEKWTVHFFGHGLPGTTLGIPDDLSHGPLDDGRARIDYMRAWFRGYDDWYIDVTDAFAPWRAMIARIDEARADAVVIWSGDNASEATFLTMACWWLGNRSERVLRVAMPGRDGRHYVATHTPAELADLYAFAQELTDTERASLEKRLLRGHELVPWPATADLVDVVFRNA